MTLPVPVRPDRSKGLFDDRRSGHGYGAARGSVGTRRPVETRALGVLRFASPVRDVGTLLGGNCA